MPQAGRAVKRRERDSGARAVYEPHTDVVELVEVTEADDEIAALARTALDLDLEP